MSSGVATLHERMDVSPEREDVAFAEETRPASTDRETVADLVDALRSRGRVIEADLISTIAQRRRRERPLARVAYKAPAPEAQLLPSGATQPLLDDPAPVPPLDSWDF
jgi:hypothetical protein